MDYPKPAPNCQSPTFVSLYLSFQSIAIPALMLADDCWLPHLTHLGRVTIICVGNLTIIGSDNGLSPGRRQAIIWTNVGILLIERSETNFSEILIEIIIFSVKKMHLKMSSGNCRPFWLGLNELRHYQGTILLCLRIDCNCGMYCLVPFFDTWL